MCESCITQTGVRNGCIHFTKLFLIYYFKLLNEYFDKAIKVFILLKYCVRNVCMIAYYSETYGDITK